MVRLQPGAEGAPPLRPATAVRVASFVCSRKVIIAYGPGAPSASDSAKHFSALLELCYSADTRLRAHLHGSRRRCADEEITQFASAQIAPFSHSVLCSRQQFPRKRRHAGDPVGGNVANHSTGKGADNILRCRTREPQTAKGVAGARQTRSAHRRAMLKQQSRRACSVQRWYAACPMLASEHPGSIIVGIRHSTSRISVEKLNNAIEASYHHLPSVMSTAGITRSNSLSHI